MKKKSRKNIYLGNLIVQRKIMVFILIFCCVLLLLSTQLSKNETYKKENGEKISGVVSNIEESGNPSGNPYKKDRNISRVDIQFTYKGKTYTVKASGFYNTIKLGDSCDVYILNNNPYNYLTVFSGIHSSSFMYIVLKILSLICLPVTVASIVMFSVPISTYKKILKNSKSIDGKFVSVEKEGKSYYIMCTSNQINGFDTIFKSHPYFYDVSDLIRKYKFTQFTIKYNPENTQKYFIDTDKLDKIYYM